ncbi:MAG: formate dehydrogenase accessory sulfurtransferase FdhD [Planctomycetota bacterium]
MKQNSGNIPDSLKHAVCSTEVLRVVPDTSLQKVADCVVSEQPVTIMVDKVGSFTIMCTPTDIKALAVGFVYSEGMIDTIDDVAAVLVKENLPNVVGIRLENPSQTAIRRNLIIASSCGMCGTRNIEKILSDMPTCAQTLKVNTNLLIEATEHLRPMQQMFKVTGGSHAAGIFTSSGKFIAFAEDLGRHSAFDKAIGKCLLNRLSTKGCAAVLSGRISLEMVTKAARAGIELIAAVSAPSSFAIEAANKWNITLCGFVRPDKINIYTHPERICNLQTGG